MDRTELLTAVRRVARVANNKSPMAILQNLRIADGYIAATDLTTTIVHPFTSDIRACVPAKRFAGFLASLEGDDVKFKLDNKSALTVSNGKRRQFKTQTIPTEEYPTLEPAGGDAIPVDAVAVAKAIRSVKHSVCTDRTRTMLLGVALSLTGDIGACASDGARVAFSGEHNENDHVLIPADVIPYLLELLKKSEQPVTFARSGYKVTFRGDYELTTKLAEDRFPPVNQIKPSGKQHVIKIDRDALFNAVKACSVACGDGAPVALEFANNELSLTVLNSSDAAEAHDTVACEFDGETGSICVEARFITDALSGTDDETVRIECCSELDPMFFYADGYRAVVMPRRG